LPLGALNSDKQGKHLSNITPDNEQKTIYIVGLSLENFAKLSEALKNESFDFRP
jgi:hypothetical protein